MHRVFRAFTWSSFSLALASLGLACSTATGAEHAPAAVPAMNLHTANPVAPPLQKSATLGAETELQRLLALAAKENRVLDHVRHLSKEIGPRLTGSKNYDRSAEWCLGVLQGFGLDARLEKWGEFPVAFDRGPQKGRIVTPVVEELVFLTPAWTPGTSGAVRGQAILEPLDSAGLERLQGRLRGAWLVRRGTRPEAKLRRAIDEACVAEGLLGYVSGARGELLVMGGNHDVKLDELPKQCRIQLRGDHFRALEERLDKGEAVELEFEIENRFSPGPIACFNVVADLRGTEFPDEYVVIGGHLDTWDGAEGAQDNGTGVATTIEAARLLTAIGAKPRRTIRFLLFGGEEQGLFGSEGYVRDHKDLLAKTSVVFIHDGGGTALRGAAPDYRMIDDFERVFAPVRELHPKYPFSVRELDSVQNSGDSDHAPFLAAGVPAFFWEQSEVGYGRVHHTQYDTFETIDPEELRHSATVAAVAALGFANLDRLVDRSAMPSGRPIARRRMGVQLDETKVTEVTGDGKAEKAGVAVGDVVLAVDGVVVANQAELVGAMQTGGSRKTLRVKRGAQELEVVLDYTGDRGEAEREERAAQKAEWLKQNPRKPKAR